LRPNHWRLRSSSGFLILGSWLIAGSFAFAASFLDRTGQSRDIVFDEEGVDEGHWQRTEQGARHQRPPLVDVALNELGDDADRDRLDLRGRNEGERIDELVPRQREREDAGRD